MWGICTADEYGFQLQLLSPPQESRQCLVCWRFPAFAGPGHVDADRLAIQHFKPAHVYAFGNTTATSSINNPFQYTGREWDSETGLYYYRARYYEPGTGRFISQDPSGFGGGINVYAYVRNKALSFSDPTGLCEEVARIKLWSSDEVTIGQPRSPWALSATPEERGPRRTS
jgi:RHS repeat-associated protein